MTYRLLEPSDGRQKDLHLHLRTFPIAWSLHVKVRLDSLKHLWNVLSSNRQNLGHRSLPQSLGGGDLDGDLYNIILLHDLFPERTVEPAAYEPTKLRTLERPCTINDVADFVVDYFMNDHLGLIAVEVCLPSPTLGEESITHFPVTEPQNRGRQ